VLADRHTGKIRVVHVIWDLSTVGGAEMSLLMMVRGFDKSQYDVSVISIGGKGGLGTEIENLGIPVIALNLSGRWSLHFKIVFALWRHFRNSRPHIVHTHLNYDALLASRFARVPILIRHEHNVYPDRAFPKTTLDVVTDRLVDRIITGSEMVTQATMARSRVSSEKITVIKWGLDIDSMVPHRPRSDIRAGLGLEDGWYVLATVASLSAKKGHVYLLDALPGILSEFPQTKLLLVGDGVQRSLLENVSETTGLTDHVVFTGIRHDISDLLSIADLFVLPSLYEGTPLALMECQTMGVPCVATRVGGTPEIVLDGGTGLLVEPGDAQALQTAIVQLLADPVRRQTMSARAVEYAKNEFDWRRFHGQLDLLYRQLVAQ